MMNPTTAPTASPMIPFRVDAPAGPTRLPTCQPANITMSVPITREIASALMRMFLRPDCGDSGVATAGNAERLDYRAHSYYLSRDPLELPQIALGNDALLEPKLLRLGDALTHAVNGPHFSAESNLTNNCRLTDRSFAHRGSNRKRRRQI